MKSRTLKAAGSVVNIWPTGSYARYMPRGSGQERLNQYWEAVGMHLRSSMSRYVIDHPPRR